MGLTRLLYEKFLQNLSNFDFDLSGSFKVKSDRAIGRPTYIVTYGFIRFIFTRYKTLKSMLTGL